MFNQMQTLCAATALIVSSPVAANAQSVAFSAKSPVAITSFAVNQKFSSGVSGGEVVAAPEFVSSGITLSFVNTDDVAVKAVTFIVDDGRTQETFVDKGAFSHGVPIRHTFAVSGDFDTDKNATCTVTDITFADGRSWHVAPKDVSAR